ncbi:hypothetical protein JB92DRAFT_3044120 [Gautieria morchelliformis]|nr:hypothetical protein JB92DRAFT_3044115 [Gautieria morchelliformis]KAF8479421.1 hypothetical protein JB92DRAFT_3044120 [Gautieria morchelliformis]
MVAPCKLIIQVLFVILLVFTVQGNAAPIPLEGREASSGVSCPGPQSSSQVPEAAVGVVHVPESQPSSGEISSGLSRPDPQNPCQDSASFLSHGPKDPSVPEAAVAAVGVVHVPEPHEDQPSHESDIFAGQAHPPAAHSFLSAHLALVITLCILTSSALCVALYVLIRCCRNRRKASRNDGRSAGGSDRSFDKRPATPPKTAEPIQAHLEYPRMVYVPPAPRDGKQPLFGHYLTPCGQVVGVKDTWTLAPMGRVVNPDGSDGLRIANPPSMSTTSPSS